MELAVEQNKLERIHEDILSFNEAVKNRDFYLLLKSPIVKSDKKQTILKMIFEEHFDELSMAFLRILVQKGREQYLPEIAKDFIVHYKAYKHISSVKITSAIPLSETVLDEIREKLLAVGETQELEVETHVEPDIVGGILLEFEGKQYDATVRHNLEKLKKDFRENLYVSKIIAR